MYIGCHGEFHSAFFRRGAEKSAGACQHNSRKQCAYYSFCSFPVFHFLSPLKIKGEAHAGKRSTAVVGLGDLQATFLLHDSAGGVYLEEASDKDAFRAAHRGSDDSLLVVARWSPEKKLRGGNLIHAIGAQGIAAVGVCYGYLDRQRLLLRPGMAEDFLAARHIVHEVVGAVDPVRQGYGAGEVVSALRQVDLGWGEGQASRAAGGRVIGPRHLQQVQRPIEQIFVTGPSSDPVAVDVEVQILRHPVRVVLREEKPDRVGRRVSRRLIVKAAIVHRVPMNKDCPKASQNIIVINRFSLHGGIGSIIRIVLAGLQAVGDLSVGCPVGGGLEIDPSSAGVVGLEVRIHGAGGNDR